MGYILILLGIVLIAMAHFAKAKMGTLDAVPLSSTPRTKPRWVAWLEAMLGPVMTVSLGWLFGGGAIFAGFILALFL